MGDRTVGANRFSLLGDLAAFGASELATKASRLIVVLALARVMDADALGLAALGLALSEMLKSLTQNGVGQMIIRAPDAALEPVLQRARRLFWVWSGGLFAAQTALAAGLWWVADAGVLAAMVAIMALEYAAMPAGLISCFLAMRAGRLRSVAAVSGAQTVGANLITALLVSFWPSPLAMACARAASGPVWAMGMRRIHPWRAQAGARPAPLRPFLVFGAGVLGVELLAAARLQADKFVIGGVLGAEALGVWFFAASAGFGLASAFSSALATAIFPRLCRGPARGRDHRALRAGLLVALGLLAPLAALQSLLAPLYVPMLFGARWAGVADLVALLCLAAAPAAVWSVAAQALRADGRPDREVSLSLAQALIATGALAAAAPHGLEAAALGFVLALTASQALSSLLALRSPAPAPDAVSAPSPAHASVRRSS